MDLRRFLVFFVLMFFVFSVSVFANSKIFEIENINSLPPDAIGNDYIIGYGHLGKGGIFIAINKSAGNVKYFDIREDGVYDEYGNLLRLVYRDYNSDTGEWDSWYYVMDYNENWGNGILIPYYTNRDIYKDGQIVLFGKEYNKNLNVFSGMSTSQIFVVIIKPFLKIMPVILIVIVMIFAFYKAWKFIKVVF